MASDPNPAPPEWTLLALLRRTAAYFREREIDSPRASAEVLLAHALGCRRIDLYLRHDQPLTPAELDRFRGLVRRRARHEPTAYITGEREFWSLPIGVDARVLIPRPDTECLVAAVLERLESAAVAPRWVLELGTGSGAVVLALARDRPGHPYWATDRSPGALATARRNARRLGLETAVQFAAGDWWRPLRPVGRWDVVVCNPPYIPRPVLATLAMQVAAFEPAAALDGGPDGLEAIRRLIRGAPEHIPPGGWLLLEIGHDQGPAVTRLGQAAADFGDLRCLQDYGGRDRVVVLRRR